MIILPMALSVSGQNLQLHYETDQDRQYPVAMLEMYKFDNWGGTYWFITMDFTDPLELGEKSLSLMYGEIARYINFKLINPLSLTLQYNDGVAFWGPMGRAWLGGVSYPLPLSKGAAQFDLLARVPQDPDGLDGQVTLAWFYPFGEGKLQFVGYWDTWTETEADGNKSVVILSEPQFWYNVWENFDLGLGVELGYNFPVFNAEEWKLYPNLSMRWNF